MAAGATHHLTSGMLHFLPALYALKLGASPVVVGLIPAAHSFPGILSAVPGGKLADRWGARTVARWTTLLRIFVILFYLSVSSPAWLMIPSFFSGALATITVVSLHTYITCVARGGQRRKDISRFALTGSVGELIGPTLIGAIVDLFGFTAAFYAIALMCALSTVASFSLPRTEEASAAETGEEHLRRMGFGGLIGHSGIQAALWGTVIVALLQGFLRGFVPALFYGRYPATQIGALFFAASVASLLGRSAISWRSERWSPAQVLPLCAMVAAGAVIVIPFAPHYSVIATSMACYGLGQGLVAVLGTVLIAESVAAEERGFANGLRLTMMRAGGTAGPLIFGPLAGIFTVVFAFVAIGGVSAAVAALLLVFAGLKHKASLGARPGTPG